MIQILSSKLETGSQRKQIKRNKMQNIISFHRIPLSILELLQILTHKLLIDDSDKFFKNPSTL